MRNREWRSAKIVFLVAFVLVGAWGLFSSAATPSDAVLKVLHEADAARALAAAAGAAGAKATAPSAPILLAQNTARDAVRIDPIRSASTFKRGDASADTDAKEFGGAFTGDEPVGMLDAAGEFSPASAKAGVEKRVDDVEKPAPPSSELINAGTYAFTATSAVALEDMSSGTTLMVPADQDDSASTIAQIGFEFWYDGVRQTLFSANANGLMRLGVANISTAFTNSLVSTTDQPSIAPYWDDLWVGNNGKVHYKVVGSAPNRKLVVEWQNEQIPRVATATAGAGTFQAWLFETSGAIQFVYGSGMAVNSTNSGYTVGLATAAASFASVTTSTNTVSYAAANNTNTVAIPSGTSYTFTPTTPTAAPGALSFTAVGLNTMTLNWADGSANEVGYAIYRSLDGVSYDFIRQTAANAVSSVETGLASNTTYFWKVVTVTEGGVSSDSSGSQATTTGTVAGTFSVGPTGAFTSLGAAITNINTNGLAGSVTLELQAAYASGVETFPLVINTLGSPSNTITIRPETGATALSITSAAATATIDLNGATNVTIDGRAGGAGPSQLTIANTAVGSVAVRLINGASRNTIKFATIQGVNNTIAGGVVLLSTTTAAIGTGNNNNTIDTCDVRDGATTPVNGIASIGTATTHLLNTANTITNSNISNFFSATLATNGILVTTNTNISNYGWTISNNRIFQTAARNYTTTNSHRGILVVGGNGYTVSGNTVGFSSAAGTGTYTMTSTAVASSFIGIQVQSGIGANSVTGNTVASISLGTTNGSLFGMTVPTGAATVSGNTIGSGTGNGSLSLTSTATGGAFIVGLNLGGASAATMTSTGNNVGSLTGTGSGTLNVNINAVQIGASVSTFSGSIIGSTTQANSIQVTTTGAAATGQQVIGLFVGTTMPITITNNTIANLTNSGTGTVHVTRGIQYQGGGSGTATPGAGTISLNSIHDISGAAANTTVAGGGTGVQGIIYTGASVNGASITQNTISTILATNTGAVGSTVCGIGYSNPTNGTVTRNTIYDIRNASTGTSATAPPMAMGILIRAALGAGATFSNNFISLGDSQSTNTQFVGLMNSFVTAGVNVFYNSVHIAGTAGGGALPSYGFLRGDNGAGSAITTPVSIINNIFNNTRTGGTGKHYAIGNVNSVPATGWGASASDRNVLNSANAATVGIWGLATDQTFAQWQASSGGDANSLSAVAVPFLAPATGDLHFNCGLTPTAVESHGTTIPGLTIDYDNQTRPGPPGSVNGGATAPDIGADEVDCVPGCTADSQCTDGNVCTTDTCNIGTATCVFTNNTVACNDGNACTTGDVCLGGVCQAGTGTLNCDDANACTDDFCTPATGCGHSNNGSTCTDGNICTLNDACAPAAAPYENFDGVTAPALPAGWTTTFSGVGVAWVTSTTGPDTAPNSAFGTDPTNIGDEALVTPPIIIYTAAAKLSFRNKFTFEGTTTCFDAGALEIKIGAGAFTDIVTAGGSFVSGGYTGTVSASFGNPLGGRSAWCFSQPAYVTTVVNLPAAASGQTVQLRWRIGSDNTTGAAGQNVDSIILTNIASCQPGPTNACDDGNPCTADSCNPNPPPGDLVTGCVHVPIAEGGSCSDGDACNGGETCDANGICQPGTPITCNDLNPCTDDACVPATGCVFTNDNTNTCTDNNVCTVDSCSGGVCVSVPNFFIANGGAINVLDNAAAAPYPSTITIPPGSGSILKVDVLLNGFTHTFPDDVDVLLVGPTGANAVILSDAGGGAPGVSNINLVLDDAAATTAPDGIGLVSGSFKPFNYDTASDPFTGAPAHGIAAALSTFIGTDPTGTWSLYVWDDAAQDVGSFTSWGLRIAVDCDDHNPCTNDSCDPTLGCIHVNNTAACDDGSACTTGDVCGGGSCQPGTPTVCSPSDQCHLAGVCDPGTGLCSNPVAPDGTACDDSVDCSNNDQCTAGNCAGTPQAPGELVNARFNDKTTFAWDSVPNNPVYDILRGAISALPVGPGGGDEVCFDNNNVSLLNDATTPAAGQGFFYLVRAQNFCGQGNYGTQKNLTPRTTTTCP
jgi:hypothetical protein